MVTSLFSVALVTNILVGVLYVLFDIFFMKFSAELLQPHRYTETRVYSLIIQRSHIHLSFGYTSNCILGLIIFNYHVVRSLLSYKYMLRFFFGHFDCSIWNALMMISLLSGRKKKRKKTIRIENSQEQIDKFLVNLSLISVLYYSFFLYSVNSVFRFKIYYYVFFLTAIKWDAQRTVGLIANFSSDFFFIQLLPLLSWKPLDNAFFY